MKKIIKLQLIYLKELFVIPLLLLVMLKKNYLFILKS